jgi:hypothetical protein
MTGVSQHWFSGHFREVFFNTIALPRINNGANVWFCVIVYVKFSSVGTGTVWGGWGLLFILGLNLAGGPVRGLRGGERRGRELDLDNHTPDLRQFTSWGKTGCSRTRKDTIVMTSVCKHLQASTQEWLD